MAAKAPTAQLFVFDSRRGNREESEHEKILAYHPADTSADDQASNAGLLQAIQVFASTFGQGSAWTSMETSTSHWLAYEAEPSIYFVLVVPKPWVPRHATESNLRAALVQCHLLAVLLAGSVQSLVDQDPRGATASAALAPILQLYARQLGSSVSLQQRELRNPLGNAAMVPVVGLSQQTSLAVQTLCNRLCIGSACGSLQVGGLVALHGKYVLWSTLQPHDTAAVYALASLAILSAVPAQQRGPEARSRQGPGTSLAQSAAWWRLQSGHVLADCGVPGVAAADCAEGLAAGAPLLYLSGGLRQYCLPYQHGALLLLLLLDAGAPAPLALQSLQPHLEDAARQLSAQVAEELKADPSHRHGIRYLVEDLGGCTVEASPRRKISAMSHHARAVAALLKDSLLRRGGDAATGQAPAPGAAVLRNARPAEHGSASGAAGGDAAAEGEEVAVAAGEAAAADGLEAAYHRPHEVVLKSSQDCWAASRGSSGQQAYVVCEKGMPSSTRAAVAHIDAMMDQLLHV